MIKIGNLLSVISILFFASCTSSLPEEVSNSLNEKIRDRYYETINNENRTTLNHKIEVLDQVGKEEIKIIRSGLEVITKKFNVKVTYTHDKDVKHIEYKTLDDYSLYIDNSSDVEALKQQAKKALMKWDCSGFHCLGMKRNKVKRKNALELEKAINEGFNNPKVIQAGEVIMTKDFVLTYHEIEGKLGTEYRVDLDKSR